MSNPGISIHVVMFMMNDAGCVVSVVKVPAILGPIITCLEQLDRIYKDDEGIHKMIDQCFGGLHKVKKDILYDFFKCAFDGSGKDWLSSATITNPPRAHVRLCLRL